MTRRDLAKLKTLIRTIPDFPKPGIQFRDITTLLLDPWGLQHCIDAMAKQFQASGAKKIVAIESRGFILGGALAKELGCGLVLARKRGKLPSATVELEYQLEYGFDCIQIHSDAIDQGEACLVIDDLLATGGTAGATCALVEKMGGRIAGCGFVINLPALQGAAKLQRYQPQWLMEF